MPAISERIINNSSDENSDCTNNNNNNNTANKKSPLVGNEFIELSVSSNEFWSKHHVVSYNQLQEFWCGLTQQARKKLMRIDKQTLFEHARKSMYCSRCNGLLLEGFLHIVMYGKSLQQGVSSDNYIIGASKKDGGSCNGNGCQDDAYDPSVHPWGGLTTTKDGTLTLLDCYLCSKSLNVVQNVFDSARARERERELLYPDACGGDSRGWTSQGPTNYGRVHGTRETCALHTAQLSVDTLEDFWSALGEETQHSLMKMKEEDFIERLMYRFESKRFCRDCRRNVIREFKQLKELKRMRREPRCSSWFCAADTAFQYEVSHDTVQADWHQTFFDSLGTYHHFEWAIGTGEGKSDILEFENVGLSVRVKVNGLDLNDLNACYITLRAWKNDGRCNELCVKAHALQGQHCVHCRLVVGDGFITITRGECIRRFFEHAEEAEEGEDDDSMDKDGNEFEGECSRPQKHAKSPELAREFLLDAATVIFKEQVEKAFREGTARQNAHSMFVSLALKLLEKRLHVACKDIVTLEKQMKLLEEEEREKREEEVRKQRRERKRTKEREKKLRRKERLKEKEKTQSECVEESSLVIDDSSMMNSTGDYVSNDVVEIRDCTSETGEASPPLASSDIKEVNDDDQQLLLAEEEYIYSNAEENVDRKFEPERSNTTYFSYDDHYHQHSRRKLRFSQPDWNSKKYDSRNRAVDGFEYSKRTINSDSNNQLTRVAGPKLIGDKCQCPPNNRVGIKYDYHSCSNTHHHNEYHNKPSAESRTWLVRDHPKYTTNKLESVASDNTQKPYYRGNSKYNTQVESATRDNSGGGRSKNKLIFGNPVKKVWEPLDSQKRYVRSNSDSDITLRSNSPKVVEVSESDQLHTDEFSGTGNDQATTDTISVSINNLVDAADLTTCSSSAGNGLKNSQKYSKRAASEDGELLTLVDSSISTSSNCSSCLSEGDGNNSSPSHLELASALSDSEESVQNASEATRETSHFPFETGKGRNGADANKIQEHDSARTTMVSSDNLPTGAAASCIENGGNVFNSSGMGTLPQSVLPQMHNNQSIHYPMVYHAPPTMGYYRHYQTPVTWPVGPANGLMSVPPHHSNHYLFANSFGYGLNGNTPAHLMQFGGLQHLPPPMLNTATHLPIFQPTVTHTNGVSLKEESKFDGDNAVVGELKEVQHNTQKDPKDAENPHNNNNKMDKGNDNGFSLFHFSGPAALSTGFKADPVALKEGDVSPKKDSIEEYNLFAASNGIKFSFF